MRRPQPTLFDTPLQQLAVLFTLAHFRASNVGVRVPENYITVVRLRREYNEERRTLRCECGFPVARLPKSTLCEPCRNQAFAS